MVLGAAALGPLLPDANLWRLGRGLWLPAAYASTVLDPTNPSNFKQDGGQTATPGSVLRLVDSSNGDIILLFAPDPDAAAGIELDVVARFQLINPIPANADAGNRVVINDGVTRSAIAAAAYPDRTRRWGPQCHRRGPGGWSLAWADSASHEW
jgi:hypothetical protein